MSNDQLQPRRDTSVSVRQGAIEGASGYVTGALLTGLGFVLGSFITWLKGLPFEIGLIVSLLVAGALAFVFERISRIYYRHQEPVLPAQPERTELELKLETDLSECQSLLKHWQNEVGREQRLRAEQVEIRDKQIGEKGGRIAELEQQLRVAQDKLDTFTVPSGALRIKSALWRAMTEDGTEFNLDLKEFFEDKYVEGGKLVIPQGLYRKMFPRDPLQGKEKILEIEFTHGGRRFFVALPENISVTLPFPYAETLERVT